MEARSVDACRTSRLAVRAEMGRLPLPRLQVGDDGRAAGQVGQAAGPLLPGDGRGAARRAGADDFVLDGELMIAVDGAPVVRRAAGAAASGREPHPQAGRRDAGAADPVRLPGDARDRQPCSTQPLRRPPGALEAFIAETGRPGPVPPDARSPAEPREAQAWLDDARRRTGRRRRQARSTAPTQPGERAMLKVKRLRTADCVVGGFRYAQRHAGRSARCCSASTMTTASSTMSASPRRSRTRSGRR